MPAPSKPYLLATGAAVGLNSLVGLLFEPSRPYTACRICGKVYQSALDRALGNCPTTLEQRKSWSHQHARSHSSTQHRQLASSGLQFTPEAANALAAFGIVPLSDMVLNDEVESAMAESKAKPFNDAEGK
jgi:hypothetical protein